MYISIADFFFSELEINERVPALGAKVDVGHYVVFFGKRDQL